MDLRIQSQYLRFLAWRERGCDVERVLFGSRKMIAVAHAKAVVDHEHEVRFTGTGRPGAIYEGIRESQSNQEEQQHAQGQQHDVAQAAVLDGTLNAALEEHQRTEGLRGAAILTKQVNPEGQADGGDTGEEPGSEKTHLLSPLPDGKVLAQR